MIRIFLFLLLSITLLCCNSNEHKSDEKETKMENDSSIQEIKSNHSTKKKVVYKSIYVTAKSGLVYRKTPAINAEKVGTFDFGTKLKILERTDIPFQVSENGKQINGEWLKVHFADYDWSGKFSGQMGYVFSGFTIDSAKADFRIIPQYYGFTNPDQQEVETKQLKLSFTSINASTFKSYPNFSNTEIKQDTTKKISEQNGGYFYIKTEKSNIKFTCGPMFRRPCNNYIGYVEPLNAHLIGAYGDGIYATFLLDEKDDAVFNLYADQDGGGLFPVLSPSNKKMATFESVDAYDSERFYDFRSNITIYDVPETKRLKDIKVSYQYSNNEWEIWGFKWVDENTFVLHVFSKHKLDSKGSRIPVNSKYLLAKF